MVNMDDILRENTKGDLSLLDIKKERKFSQDQLEHWFKLLKAKFPEMPEGMLIQTLDMYSTHPHIFDEVVEDEKKNPEKYVKKEEPLRFPKLSDEETPHC